MRYIDEFRHVGLAQGLAQAIAREVQAGRQYRFMEFCGGHTHALSRHGIADLLPASVRMIHGPGCPVCVLPIGRVDQAIALAQQAGVLLCTYGDCLRVPASGGDSLQQAKARGADVRMVHSSLDALALARQHPDRQVVFLAIGFETTTPPTAVAIQQAAASSLKNFSVLCCHVLTPPAMAAILDSPAPDAPALDGLVGPAHVSVVIGSRPYEALAARYGKPLVIAGFEPLDLLQAIRMLVAQVNQGRCVVENEFSRAVSRDGNRKAQQCMAEVFVLREQFEWRGLGELAASALRIGPRYAAFDAEQRFGLHYRSVPDHKGCDCGAILRGARQPPDCRLFGRVCTPEHALGACMVSPEGACAAHYSYARRSHV